MKRITAFLILFQFIRLTAVQPVRPVNTYSIEAYDEKTGELGSVIILRISRFNPLALFLLRMQNGFSNHPVSVP